MVSERCCCEEYVERLKAKEHAVAPTLLATLSSNKESMLGTNQTDVWPRHSVGYKRA